MKLKVAATGSKGNCYVLQEDDGHSVILDAGIPYKAFLKAIGHNIQHIDGCLITHEHMDHASAVIDMVASGMAVHMSKGTMGEVFDTDDRLKAHVHVHKASEPFRLGSWTVKPFYTHHDAAEPFGYLLKHNTADAKVLYLTDTSHCEYQFPKLTHIIIECNYSLEIINSRVKSGHMNNHLRSRILGSHIGLETLIPWLTDFDKQCLEKIILVHLSDGNSDALKMKNAVQEATGIETVIAEEGLLIELSSIGF